MLLELVEKTDAGGGAFDTLSLPFDRRQKSRQRVRLDGGDEAALLLPPGTTLHDGDGLLASNGSRIAVRASAEAVTTIRSDDPVLLARACYHLGNRHVSLQVGAGWARFQPDHVLEDMVRGLGLEVVHENAPFEPERGAYGFQASGHGHAHTHGHVRGAATPGDTAGSGA